MKKTKNRERLFTGWEPLEHRLVLSTVAMTPPPLDSTSGPGTLAPAVSIQNFKAAQEAFQTFQQTYSVDVSTILFAKDASGQVDPMANRSTFDADVSAALDALDASLESIVAGLNNGPTLASNINNTLVGSGPQSVQSQLKATTTPTATTATATTPTAITAASTSATARLVQLKSAAIIDAVARQITLDILEATPISTSIGTPATTGIASTEVEDLGDSSVSNTLSTSVSDTLETPVSPTMAHRHTS